MANTLTLDALREQIETKYGPFILEGFPGGGPIYLLPILRLPRKQRDKFSKAAADMAAKEKQRAVDETDSDLNETVDTITALLGLVAEKPGDIERIKKALADDAQMMLEIWEQYQAATKLGEAPPSES